MAKNKTHQRNLERARANRGVTGGGGPAGGSSGAPSSGMNRNQIIALVLVAILAASVLAVALASRGDNADVGSAATATPTENATDPSTTTPTADPVAGSCDPPVAEAPEPTSKVYDAAPAVVIDAALAYTANIATTCGDISIELFAEGSPAAVNNFVFLARDGYYDGVPYHRVVDGFMIQGGDPSGTGFGGEQGYPGYSFDDELEFTASYHAAAGGTYAQGTVAMANAGANTNGSQFFIMDDDFGLPPQYVIFGRVLTGQDVVDKISEIAVDGETAVNPVRIVSVEIVES